MGSQEMASKIDLNSQMILGLILIVLVILDDLGVLDVLYY